MIEKISYINVYDKVKENGEKYRHVIDPLYSKGTEEHDLGDGCSLRVNTYERVMEMWGTNRPVQAVLCQLFREGRQVTSFFQYGDARTAHVARVVRHSSGREYFLFKEDLYGLSVMDLADGRCVRYIPEGYRHKPEYLYGESLIVTGIHYHPASDLIALDGCYWAGPGEVYVFDFSDPFIHEGREYRPCFFSLRERFDSDYDEGTNIDFAAWEGDRLLCSCDGERVSVAIDDIRNCITERQNNSQ